MIRLVMGLTAGLVAAYLTAPGTGRAVRVKLVSFIHQEVEGVNLISQQWQTTVGRARQAWNQLKTATGFWPAR